MFPTDCITTIRQTTTTGLVWQFWDKVQAMCMPRIDFVCKWHIELAQAEVRKYRSKRIIES